MKKLVYTVFIAFWAAIGTLTLVNTLAPDIAEEEKRPVRDDTEPTEYSMVEVEEHASLDDCWMVIEGVVYDVSEYVPRHPAPPRVLKPWCGREATEGMRTKGDDSGDDSDGNSDHSARAWRMLERYRIGELQ